jgi:uncharacterized protein
VRFAASFPKIALVLSGMGNMAMMNDNLGYMTDLKPPDEKEMTAITRVREILKTLGTTPCTACHYCTDGCPEKILIPDLFADYNAKKVFKDWNSDFYYNVHTSHNGKASDFIKCGKCERSCPQHLPVREFLEQVRKTFVR